MQNLINVKIKRSGKNYEEAIKIVADISDVLLENCCDGYFVIAKKVIKIMLSKNYTVQQKNIIASIIDKLNLEEIK